jgi:glycosyltransferase 2 family protein
VPLGLAKIFTDQALPSAELRGLSTLLETIAATPEDLLRNGPMFVQTSLIHLSVFVLDALTFWVIFKALGAPIGFMTAFVAFVMASVVATISFVPLGLGTFEASAVTILSVLGVGLEVGLAATPLLRRLTLWLPMLPRVWLARREMRGAREEV